MPNLVSILMTFRNEEKYLSECLDSILTQSHQNWELIAIDDHSTDSSQNILKHYSEKDSRIRFFPNKEKGIIAALRYAFKQSKGNWITRMDADDIMTEQKIQSLLGALEGQERGTISTGFVKYFFMGESTEGYLNYEKWLNQLTTENSHFDSVYRECVVASPCWMIHRDDLIQANGFDSDIYPEDYDLCFRFYEQGFQVVGVPDTLHLWRDSPERASRNDPNYQDPHFYPLKMHYFLNLEVQDDDTIVIWSSGKKGKKLAKLLVQQKKKFRWVCNNPNKIGQIIYDVLIEDWESLPQFSSPKIIVPIAIPHFQEEITEYFESFNLLKNQDFFMFA
jgi:glycosyltransferase involved in cell wall biosynthesis